MEKKHVILLQHKGNKKFRVTTLYNEEFDGPLDKIKGCEIIHRKDLIICDDGIIRWRSSMDAGAPDPWIGENINDHKPKKNVNI